MRFTTNAELRQAEEWQISNGVEQSSDIFALDTFVEALAGEHVGIGTKRHHTIPWRLSERPLPP